MELKGTGSIPTRDDFNPAQQFDTSMQSKRFLCALSKTALFGMARNSCVSALLNLVKVS